LNSEPAICSVQAAHQALDDPKRRNTGASPNIVVPWFEGDRPISTFTLSAPPRNLRYQRGIIPPWLWPTMSTSAAPVAARTCSMNAPSSAAESRIGPTAYEPCIEPAP
jgi:hypothetical protein